MKKLYFLTLLFTCLTGFASPPVINNPSPIQVCDDNSDGTTVFDLTPKISEVLGALNPSLYSVTFHETQTDAELGGASLPTPNSFVNIIPFTQTVYVRVQENLSGEYSITSLDLIVNAAPNIGTPLNLSIEQIPFTGTAIFDLTTNDIALVNGSPNSTVAYFTTLIDAQSNVNQIPNEAGLFLRHAFLAHLQTCKHEYVTLYKLFFLRAHQ